MRIRLAVAVQENGNWQCAGWQNATDEQMRRNALDCLDPCDSESVHYVEVDVPLPDSQTFEGKVVCTPQRLDQLKLDLDAEGQDHSVDHIVKQYLKDNPNSRVVEWELAEIIRISLGADYNILCIKNTDPDILDEYITEDEKKKPRITYSREEAKKFPSIRLAEQYRNTFRSVWNDRSVSIEPANG